MFKHTLFVGLLLLFTIVPTAAQEDQQNILLIAHRTRMDTTVSALNIDTGIVETLFTVDTGYTEFSLSPTGDRLAYFAITPASRGGGDYSSEVTYYLREVFADASTEVATNGVLGGNSTFATAIEPSWSPDGEQIVVLHRNEQNEDPQFSIIDATTGETTRIIQAEPLPAFYPPEWSPDGTYLAYFAEWCSRCGLGHVYLVSTTSEDAPHSALAGTGYPLHDILIGWLPNSREMLIRRTEDGYRHSYVRLMRVNIDIGEKHEIVEPETFDQRTYLAPLDSTTLLAIGNDDGNYNLQVINLVTGDTRFPRIEGEGSISYFSEVRFSPDKTRVAFPVSTDYPMTAILSFDLITGEHLSEINLPSAVSSILWTQDGERLVYQTSFASDKIWIFSAKVDGSEEPHAIVELSGTLLGWAQTDQ